MTVLYGGCQVNTVNYRTCVFRKCYLIAMMSEWKIYGFVKKSLKNDLLKSDDFTRNLKIRISLFVKILFLVFNYQKQYSTAFWCPLTICRQNLKLTQVFQSRVFRKG